MTPWILPTWLLACSSDHCKGDAAANTVVTFDKDYLTPSERAERVQTITEQEAPIRDRGSDANSHFDPYCFFNGIQVSDDVKDDDGEPISAKYNPNNNKIYARENLGSLMHEFCHHVEFEYEKDYGLQPWEESDWQDVSCHDNDFALEDCADNFTNLARSSDEEFANVCSVTIQNPAGAMARFASNANTYRQARFAASAVGVPEESLEKVDDQLLAASDAVVFGEETEIGGYYDGEGGARFATCSDGSYSFLDDFGDLVLHAPQADGSWRLIPLATPRGFDRFSKYSIDVLDGQVVLQQDGLLFVSTRPEDALSWKRTTITLAPERRRDGKVVFLNGEPAFFAPMDYELYADTDPDSGTSSTARARSTYPSSLMRQMASGKMREFYGMEGRAFLWIDDVEVTEVGPESVLYEVQANGDGLAFKQVLRVPSPGNGSRPLLADGRWYLVQQITNDVLSDGSWTDATFSVKPMMLVEVLSGGKTLQPIGLQYLPGEEAFRRNLGTSIPPMATVSQGRISTLGLLHFDKDGLLESAGIPYRFSFPAP